MRICREMTDYRVKLSNGEGIYNALRRPFCHRSIGNRKGALTGAIE
jgi:hypothetical protein